MSCCCDINTNSPCSIDEAVKTLLVDEGVTAALYAGGLGSGEYPSAVFEVLQPSEGRSSGCCYQHTAVLQARIYATSSQAATDLSNDITTILKSQSSIESQVGNFRVRANTVPTTIRLPDKLFLTRVNYSLVIWTPKEGA